MLLRVAVACTLIAAGVWIFVAKASHRMPDFEVYWRAGARAAAAEPLYRPSDADYQFKYLPPFAIAAIPLGVMPLTVAKVVWFTLSAVALVGLISISVALLPDQRQPLWLLLAALMIGLGKYYAEDLVLGQINTVVTLVASLAILAAIRGRETAAGLLVALAIVLKPYALVLAPWIAARRQPRSVAAMTIGLAIAGLLPVVVYGVDGTTGLYHDWWRTVTTTTDGTLLHSDNVSLASLWAKRLGVGSTAAALAMISSALVLAATVVVFARRHRIAHPEVLEAGMLLAITPLISPQGWDYVLVLATIAVLVVINGFDRLPRTVQALTLVALAAVGLTLFDLLGRRLTYALLNRSAITIGMLVLIAAVVTLRMRKLA